MCKMAAVAVLTPPILFEVLTQDSLETCRPTALAQLALIMGKPACTAKVTHPMPHELLTIFGFVYNAQILRRATGQASARRRQRQCLKL